MLDLMLINQVQCWIECYQCTPYCFCHFVSGIELAKCFERSERGRNGPGVMGREGKVPSSGEDNVNAPMEKVVAAADNPVSTGDAKCDYVSICCGNANGGGEIDSSANEKLDIATSANVTEAEKSELGLNCVETFFLSSSIDMCLPLLLMGLIPI
jgi:hypothetical protein